MIISNKILKTMCEEIITEFNNYISVLNDPVILNDPKGIGLEDEWNERIIKVYEIVCNHNEK